MMSNIQPGKVLCREQIFMAEKPYKGRRAYSNWNRNIVLRPTIHKALQGDIARVIYEIEVRLLNSLKGYQFLKTLSTQEKSTFRRHIGLAIQQHLLNLNFKRALAEEILTNLGIPRFDSPLYAYFLKHWYRGNVKRLIQDFQHMTLE